MGEIRDRFASVFRDYVLADLPASGRNDPDKAAVRALAIPIEAGIAAAALAGTDLNAAMTLVAPLLTSAQASQRAAEGAAYSLDRALISIPASVATQMAGAVAAATNQANLARDSAQLASATALAATRYYATRSAGEAASAVNQLFSTDDGAGSLIFYRRTSGGSTEVSRAVSPVTLAGYARNTGAVSFRTGGSRIGVTDAADPMTPQALFNIVNTGTNTNGLRVTSYWTGSGASPYQNNDNSLWEVFNKVASNSANQSWSISAANAYNDIPAGVVDSGIRYGVFGWATSVRVDGYVHAGTLEQQVGVGGVAGFQETGTPTSAVVNNASAIRGVIRADSPGATIGNARAGEFITVAGAGRKLNNFGVYVEASGGVETNWSFFGASGALYNAGQAFFGTIINQSGARASARGINAVEFGNADLNGYGSTIGATAASGYPFLAFCAEADPTGNTYRTRGRRGSVIWNDLQGALVFSRVVDPNKGGQALADDLILRPDGKLAMLKNPRLLGTAPASATAAGETGEIAWDGGYFYVCVADNTWKRTALATW